MENKPQLLTHSAYPQEKTIHVLALRVSAKLFATLANWKKYSLGVKTNLLHNWDLLKDADLTTMYTLLSEMIAEFKTDCVKKDAPMLFRIHWDGRFL